MTRSMSNSRKPRRQAVLAILIGSVVSGQALATDKPAPAGAANDPMQQMMMTYTPDLKQQVMKLSPELKKTVQQLHAQHTRKSKQLTMRQVMQEILSEYQSIAAAISVDNAEQAADSARRLANHRIPKGGLFPYFDPKNVNDADLGVLPTMNTAVEGSALKLAEAAEKGDMAKAAGYLSDIMVGCVACHDKFRGQPGVSARIIAPDRK